LFFTPQYLNARIAVLGACEPEIRKGSVDSGSKGCISKPSMTLDRISNNDANPRRSVDRLSWSGKISKLTCKNQKEPALPGIILWDNENKSPSPFSTATSFPGRLPCGTPG
jgi:hypothetical protein